jgi:putative ABC transport system permease protein
LGASVAHIVSLVNREFLGLLLAAAFFASISGYFAVQALLRSIYSYYVGFSALPFMLASLSVFAVAAVTVGSQVVRVATANPVASLRYE